MIKRWRSTPKIKRSVYLFTALAVLASAILVSFFIEPKANAEVTVGTSSISNPSAADTSERAVVITSTGTIVAFFNAGTLGSANLVYSTSTNDGASWGGETNALSDLSSIVNFSVAIDSSNNIYVTGKGTNGSSAVVIEVVRLAYSAGTWSAGSTTTFCTAGGVSHEACGVPTIAVNGSNTIEAAYCSSARPGVTTTYGCSASVSTDGTSWSATSTIPQAISSLTYGMPIVGVGSAFWAVSPNGELSEDASGTDSWTMITSLQTTPTGGIAMSVGGSSSDLMVAYLNSSGIVFERYGSSTGSYISSKTISSSTSDLLGSIGSDSGGLIWVFYSKYLASNSYNVQALRYSGSAWDSSPYAVTSDGVNNLYVNAPLSESSLSNIPIIWTIGTASPYSVVTANVPPPSSNSPPAAPTLSAPSSGATGISTTPQFQLKTTDADNDYLQYRVYLYQSDCSTPVGSSPFTQASSQTGWSGQDANASTAYVGSSTLSGSTLATYTYQGTLSYSTIYCWKADAIDPGGSNTYSSTSASQSFTTAANSPPNAPTLSTPGSGATGTATTLSFTLSTTDPNGDSIKYRLYLYQSDCSTAVSGSPFAQATTPAGWDNGSTAYASGATATYTYQSVLANSTTYCWKADAIDPSGSNTYGSASSTRTFTTLSSNSSPTIIHGGAIIQGGSSIF